MSSVGAKSRTSSLSRRTSPPSHSDAEPLSPSIGEEDDDDGLEEETISPAVEGTVPVITRGLVNGTATRGRSPRTAQIQKPSAQNTREIESLQTKIRVLEKKRVEDREKLKDLDRLQEERDRFEGLIQKLQQKYQPQQGEISNLKKKLQEALEQANSAQAQSAEHDSAVEMATLDREMAEETAEALRSELEALRQRHEEVELEIEILREENGELGKEMSAEERASQGWAQMERSNERLREALVRLRDVSQQQEIDLKDQIAEFEKDLQELGAVKEERDATKERLTQSEVALEDLRQQLDMALGAEEMIEELTERNDTLNQRLADAKAAIEELESLRELNDELELNHVETEKQMQDEIEYSESLLIEQKRKVTTQDSNIQDLEYTVLRFRELVSTMQSDLEQVRASRQLSEAEANELSSKSKDMMDLNLRLQASATKSQVRAIDLELNKMAAQESTEHLDIVQHLLPDWFKIERNCILAFLRSKRIGFKARLLQSLVRDRAEAGERSVDPFACYDVLDKLTLMSTSSKAFSDFVQTCDLASFSKLESALHDLEPVEKALTGWIEDVKREAFKGAECGQELYRWVNYQTYTFFKALTSSRLNSLLSHLIEIHITESLPHQASEMHSGALVLQSYIETSALCVGQSKSLAQSRIPISSQEDLDTGSEDVHAGQDFARRADDLASSLHSLKVVAQKCVRNLNDLNTRSLALDPASTASITLEQALTATENFASVARDIGSSLLNLFNEEGRTAPFTYDEITLTISNDDNPFSSLVNLLPVVTTALQTFHQQTSTLSHIIELPPPNPAPWLLLAQNLKERSTSAKENEESLARVQQEMAQKNTVLALREKDKEEMSVQIEVLTQRVNESGGRREKVRELEEAVNKVQKENKIFKNEIRKREEKLSELETEKQRWAQDTQPPPSPNKRGTVDPGGAYGDGVNLPPSTVTVQKISALEAELATQRSAIRHLRSQLTGHDHAQNMAFLSSPLIPATTAPSQSSKHIHEESHACLSTLLSLATSNAAQPISIDIRRKEDRLKWRPKRQSSEWKLSVLREEYEGWNTWIKDLTKKAEREGKRRRPTDFRGDMGKGQVESGEVRVVGAEEEVVG